MLNETMNTLKTIFRIVLLPAAAVLIGGCGAGQQEHDRGFFTSGDREADQRADQRMAAAQQLKDTKSNPLQASDTQKSLYDRLGGEAGMHDIVGDFVTRAMADPRINWPRKGVTKGGIVHRGESVEWNPTDANVEQMKKHIAQFLTLSTGGPSNYDGKDMKSAHAGMRITNPEFDAAVGDLKATLDKLHIGDKEQRELLAIIETTREQIVEER
jgi:hemoglobin